MTGTPAKALKLSLIVLIMSAFSSAQALRFDRACEPADTLIIGAVGDVLLHQPLQVQGYNVGFRSLWKDVEPFMKGSDIMYANYEGPSAAGTVSTSGKTVKDPGPVFDKYVYSGYPHFNYHRSSIAALKASGVDILSTANNHSLDRGTTGAIRTIEAMNAEGMPYSGTRTQQSEEFYRITQQKGWKIAWVACTYSTNGIPDPQDLVLDCFDTGRVSQYIKALKNRVDAVIVTPHWGNEYALSPNNQQKNFGRQWLEDGATAVIGAHPHVPQPWEKHITSDGREGLILYSLGNFVSNQVELIKRTSMFLFLGLSKKGSQTWVNGVRYLPLYMYRTAGARRVVAPNFVQDSKNGEVAKSLQTAIKFYGDERILWPGEDVVTNPECD